MKLRIITYLLFVTWSFSTLSAQLEITSGSTPPFTPENLVENVFLGSGVEVTGVVMDGSPNAVGFFSGASAEINLDRGIVISSSLVKSIDKTNTSTANVDVSDFTNGGTTDSDLQAIATGPLRDVFSYTISFIPASDTLRFRYVFASEEYPEFVCNDFNDIFGFFISGPNPDGGSYASKNIALVPDPSDPSGLTFTNVPVAIDNIQDGSSGNCAASFSDFYNINPVGMEHFKYDAFTSIFTAEAIVVPCEEYTIKLAVADVGDNRYGSCVFLEAKSFGTGTLDVSLNSLSIDGSLAEGCSTGFLEFVLPDAVDQDYLIDIDFLTLPNSATSGVDFSVIPSQIVIPSGSSSVSIPVEAFSDNVSEVDEIIAFEIQVDNCNRKQFQIIITDNELVKPILPPDRTQCDSEEFLIDSELDPSFVLPPNPYFENLTEMAISPEMEPIYSDISVSGVVPIILTPDVIESVCIIGLEHRDLTDFDIFLISPGGQFLELSTDNGFKVNNVSDIDRFENTCFSPTASTNINNGARLAGPFFDSNPTYSGDFLPEGVWSDLWDAENPTNGTYRLLVIDDTNGFEGTLEGWSITFRSAYNLTYEWSSIPVSTLCENCEDITVSPDVDTEYTLRITDSYGCEQSESINITVTPSLAEPMVSCGTITENSIEMLWNTISGNLGYEVRVNGGAWIPVNSEKFAFIGLTSNTLHNLEVRTIGVSCYSNIASVQCRTDDCARPSVSFSVEQEVTCPGGDDGGVIITASGAEPLTYIFGTLSNSTGIFSEVPKGEHLFVVVDDTGCSDTVGVVMTEPADFELIPRYRLSDPCNVVSNITGFFDITGGTPPYTYAWSNQTTNEEATNLSKGQYLLTVTDARNCVKIGELIIPDLDPFSYTITTKPPLCIGQANGTATIVAVSGVGPYTYQWQDGSSDGSNENLAADFYVVTVTDALGCSDPRTFTIDPGPMVQLTVDPKNVSCKGGEDGEASVFVTGGLPPYKYFWNAGTSNGAMTEGLAPGDFTVFVSDANNCMVSKMFTITEPQGINYKIARKDNLCSDGLLGEISISDAVSPNGPVSILWEDGSDLFDRINLPNGEYCFTLSDGTACELSYCDTIISPLEILVTEMIKSSRCENSEDGRIELTVMGGAPPYNFMWSGPSTDIPNSAIAENLMAGDYSVTIEDANSCEVFQDYLVNPVNPPKIDSTVFDIDCKGESTGQIFFSVSDVQVPVTYSWTGPDGFSANTNNIIGVKAGSYTVTFQDQANCIGMREYLIMEPILPLTANISAPDTICYNGTDGKLTAMPTGGTAPYEILWSNNSTSAEIFGLEEDTYQVTIEDSRGCKVSASSFVYENDQINIELSQSPSSCFRTSDGGASIVEINYGTEPADPEDFEIAWNTSPGQDMIAALNLVGGSSYTTVVTDRYGCMGQRSIDIESPELVGAEISSFTNVSCFNGSDGKVEIAGTGGTGSYSYQWDVNASNATANEIDGLRRGEYIVTVTDGNGCTGVRRFNVEEPRPLSMDFRVINVSCSGGSNGRAEAIVKGGVGPYSFSWTNNTNEMAITDVISAQYNVTVTDANGCMITDSTKVEEPQDTMRIDWIVDAVSCYGGSNGRIRMSASGGSGFYKYSIDGVEFTSSRIFSNLPAGSYDLYASDIRGCAETFLNVSVSEPEPIIVDLGDDITIPFATTIALDPVVIGDGNLSYHWKSANLELLSCTNCANPIFDGQREASYELVVTDEMGCVANDFVTIRLENFSPFFVPTAFTPNGDSENDVLRVFGEGIEIVNSFSIHKRWGEMVFQGQGLEIGDELLEWDGVYNGQESPIGVYYWFAEVTYETGFQETFRGETTILR